MSQSEQEWREATIAALQARIVDPALSASDFAAAAHQLIETSRARFPTLKTPLMITSANPEPAMTATAKAATPTMPLTLIEAVSNFSAWLKRPVESFTATTAYWVDDDGDTLLELSWEESEPVLTLTINWFLESPYTEMLRYAIIGYCAEVIEYREVGL